MTFFTLHFFMILLSQKNFSSFFYIEKELKLNSNLADWVQVQLNRHPAPKISIELHIIMDFMKEKKGKIVIKLQIVIEL